MNKYAHIIVMSFVFSLSTAFADIGLVSKTSTGEQGNGGSGSPVVSADGPLWLLLQVHSTW